MQFFSKNEYKNEIIQRIGNVISNLDIIHERGDFGECMRIVGWTRSYYYKQIAAHVVTENCLGQIEIINDIEVRSDHLLLGG